MENVRENKPCECNTFIKHVFDVVYIMVKMMVGFVTCLLCGLIDKQDRKQIEFDFFSVT